MYSIRKRSQLAPDRALPRSIAFFSIHYSGNDRSLNPDHGKGTIGEITLPTSVAQERETNPFVRATNWEEFARLRSAKDSFRS